MFENLAGDQARNPEFQSALVRLAACLLGALYIALGASTGYYAVDVPYYLVVFGLYLAATLAFMASIARQPVSQPRRYLGIVLDILAVSLAIFLTREAISPFYLLYILVFISAGTRYGQRHLLLASVVAVIAYNAVLLALDEWQQHPFEAAFFLILLILLPLYQAALLRQVRAARDEAERANRAKGDFLAFMTHELRTPLTGVLGMTELLRDTALTARQREYVEAIASSASMLGALIGDILDFSKIDAHQLVLEAAPLAPRPLVREVATLLAARAAAKGLELHAEVADDVPEVIQGDALRLRQILFNLLGNAVKFTERGEVRVRVSRAPGDAAWPRPHLLLEVMDTGIGIAASELPHVFDSFRQADRSTTRRFGGTGLGTTIARELVLLMGGDIGVESRVGEGTRFWVRLPLSPPASPPADAAETMPAAGGEAPDRPAVPAAGAEVAATTQTPPTWSPLSPALTSGRCILVAEDNDIAATVITRFLGRLGLASTRVSDGAAALAATAERDYALAIVDLRMPVLDGIAFARRYRASETGGHHMPILALTANACADVRRECLSAGMDGFLAKPVNPIALRESLEVLLASLQPADVIGQR